MNALVNPQNLIIAGASQEYKETMYTYINDLDKKCILIETDVIVSQQCLAVNV